MTKQKYKDVMRNHYIRITADLDNTSLKVAQIRTKCILDYLFTRRSIVFDRKEIVKSSRGKGVHIILWTREFLTDKDIFLLRAVLGDDYKRLLRDKQRPYPKQYLFDKKSVIPETKHIQKMREKFRDKK